LRSAAIVLTSTSSPSLEPLHPLLASAGGGLDQSATTLRKRHHSSYVVDGCLSGGRGVIFPDSYLSQSRIMKLPSIIIAGFPKCATTSLFYYLSSALELAAPQIKEPGLFSNWYQFDPCTATQADSTAPKHWTDHIHALSRVKKITPSDYSAIYSSGFAPIDATPDYLLEVDYFIESISSLYARDSLPYILIMTRDPIKRLLSHYNMFIRDGYEYLPIELAISLRMNSTKLPIFYDYVTSSLYSNPIRKILDSQLSEKVLILDTDTLASSPEAVFASISRHCGVQLNIERVKNRLKYNASAAVTRQSPIDKNLLSNQGLAKKLLRSLIVRQEDRDKLKSLYYYSRSALRSSSNQNLLELQKQKIPHDIQEKILQDHKDFLNVCADRGCLA